MVVTLWSFSTAISRKVKMARRLPVPIPNSRVQTQVYKTLRWILHDNRPLSFSSKRYIKPGLQSLHDMKLKKTLPLFAILFFYSTSYISCDGLVFPLVISMILFFTWLGDLQAFLPLPTGCFALCNLFYGNKVFWKLSSFPFLQIFLPLRSRVKIPSSTAWIWNFAKAMCPLQWLSHCFVSCDRRLWGAHGDQKAACAPQANPEVLAPADTTSCGWTHEVPATGGLCIREGYQAETRLKHLKTYRCDDPLQGEGNYFGEKEDKTFRKRRLNHIGIHFVIPKDIDFD